MLRSKNRRGRKGGVVEVEMGAFSEKVVMKVATERRGMKTKARYVY